MSALEHVKDCRARTIEAFDELLELARALNAAVQLMEGHRRPGPFDFECDPGPHFDEPSVTARWVYSNTKGAALTVAPGEAGVLRYSALGAPFLPSEMAHAAAECFVTHDAQAAINWIDAELKRQMPRRLVKVAQRAAPQKVLVAWAERVAMAFQNNSPVDVFVKYGELPVDGANFSMRLGPNSPAPIECFNTATGDVWVAFEADGPGELVVEEA